MKGAHSGKSQLDLCASKLFNKYPCVLSTFLDRLLVQQRTNMYLTQKKFTAATRGERKELRDCIGFGSFRKYVKLESKSQLVANCVY